MSAQSFPVLHTERLTLRQAGVADVLPLLRIMQDPEVLCYYGMPSLETEQQALAEIFWFNQVFAQGAGIRWVIARQDASDYIGDVGFFKHEKQHARAEVGYRLVRSCWGQGLMTEALAAAVEYGFAQMALNRIEALADPRNGATLRVLSKVGFIQEGLLREYEIEQSRPVDLVMLSLLKREWRQSTAS
ncbi:MAG: GNAT family N-acetyltransferase [Anaerolineae bacterium]|nr:GNAT family N-acetyltransferase [Anaerolineae bacterium]